MKGNNFKFKRNFYTVMRDMTDKQAGEFIKGVCGYVFDGKPLNTKDEYLKGVYIYVKRELDVSAMNAVNGKKGAEKLAEIKQKQKVANNLGMLIETVVVTSKKDKNGQTNK